MPVALRGLWLAPIAKGIAMAIVLIAGLDIAFLKALIIAVVSATLSGVFMLVGIMLTNHYAQQVRKQLDDVQAAQGANRRRTDSAGNPSDGG